MKKVDKPAGYLFLKAYTQWDICDFAIVALTEQWIETMKQRLDSILHAKDTAKDDSLYCQTYWDGPEGFYHFDGEDATDMIEGLEDSDETCFISCTDDELEKLPQPESTLTTFILHIDTDGQVHYTAHGKHTTEQFWTTAFDLTELLHELQS